MKSKSGFTLIEVLVVISVITIISSIAVVAFVGQQRQARDTKRATDLVSITEVFDRYYATNGSYPLTCGVSAHVHLACGGATINAVYDTFQPFTITPTTTRSALIAGLPQIPDSLGNPRAASSDPPINHTVSNSIVTSTYFVFSPDLLPNQSPATSSSVSFYANEAHSSTFTCSFSLTTNIKGNAATKPHRYIVGFYSEHSAAWKFFISPNRADVNTPNWPSVANPLCTPATTGDLKLLSSS